MYKIAIVTDETIYKNRFGPVFSQLELQDQVTILKPFQLYDVDVLIIGPPFNDDSLRFLQEARRKEIRSIIDLPAWAESEINNDSSSIAEFIGMADAIWLDEQEMTEVTLDLPTVRLPSPADDLDLENVTPKWLHALEMLDVDLDRKPLVVSSRSRSPKNVPISITIPIYNAFDDVVKCVESVVNNSDLNKNSLIIINDGSSDERILPYLEKVAGALKQDGKNIELINHVSSLGFLKTANEGMSASQNDVVILNSDTIVGPLWLEKLQKCAYSHESVGFCCPVSNNATILSLPWIGTDVEKINSALEEIDHPYIDLPTCIGFCMYIKRDVFEKYGYFDEIFGTGYGEENDLTQRARGEYRCLADTRNFVFHKGGASFTGLDSHALENEALLEKRHPNYKFYLILWDAATPLMHLRALLLRKLSPKPVAIQVLHKYHNIGGTEAYTQCLVGYLRDEYENLIIYVDDEQLVVTDGLFYRERIPISDLPEDQFFDRDLSIESAFSKVINAFTPDVVHFQHLIHLPVSLVGLAKDLGAKVLITLHDSYALCQDPHLLGRPSIGIDHCLDIKKCIESDCLDRKFKGQITENSHIARRLAIKNMLDKVDVAIVPSPFNAKITESFGINAIIVQHGQKFEPTISSKKGQVQKIGFIGGVCLRKGTDILIEAFSRLGRKDLELHIYGSVGSISEHVLSLPRPQKMYFHEQYKQSDLPEIVNNIDLGVVPSIFPESYCFTLDELSALGAPTIVSNCGALPERVLPEMVFEPNVDALVKKFRQVIGDGKLRSRAVEHTRSLLKPESVQMGEIVKLYAQDPAPTQKRQAEDSINSTEYLISVKEFYTNNPRPLKKVVPDQESQVNAKDLRTVPPGTPKLDLSLEKVGRNEPCPCGSGLKYKKCHALV